MSGKLLSLMDLPKAQTFNIHEAVKVDMIGEHKNFVLITF